MKRFMIASVLAAVTATSAMAYTSDYGLTNSTRNEVLQLVPAADLSTLSPDQVRALELFFDDSQNLSSGNNPRGKVKLILDRG